MQSWRGSASPRADPASWRVLPGGEKSLGWGVGFLGCPETRQAREILNGDATYFNLLVLLVFSLLSPSCCWGYWCLGWGACVVGAREPGPPRASCVETVQLHLTLLSPVCSLDGDK